MPSDPPRPEFWQSLWPLRAVWLVAPFVVGPALAEALDDRGAITAVASSMAWAGWAIVLVATLVPRTVSLTVVRMIAPGSVPLAVWAAVECDDAALGALAVVGALVATSLALLGPGVADAFVDGSSYGDERRVALRVPVALLVLPVPATWLVAAAGVVAGPLLLAAEQWILGVILTALGIVAAIAAGRRIHALSRRWLVFVPAGVVVHDPLHLTEPILFPTRSLLRFGPATEVGDAVDVTGQTLGLVLEVRPTEPVTAGLRRGREVEEAEGVAALLVSPTRPGATLVVARSRRLPVA